MVQRVKAIFICQFKGFFRKAWLWPVALVILLSVIGGSFVATEVTILEKGAEYVQLLSGVLFIVILLLGLSQGCDEKDRRIIIHLKSLPHKYVEEYVGTWLALSAYAAMLVLLTLFAFAAYNFWESADVLLASNSTRDTKGKVHTEKQERSVLWKAEDGLREGQTFSFIPVFFKPGGPPAGLPSLATSFYWTDGEKKEEVKVNLMTERISVVPESKEGLTQLMAPKLVNSKLGVLEMHHRGVFLHESGLSFVGVLGGLLLNLLLKFMLFAGLVTGFGKKLSLETGVFIVFGLACVSFIFSTMGSDIVEDVVKKKKHYGKLTQNFTEMWWERNLLTYTENMIVVQKVANALRFPDDLKDLKENRWVATPLQNPGRAWPFVLCFVIILVSIPLSRSKIP